MIIKIYSFFSVSALLLGLYSVGSNPLLIGQVLDVLSGQVFDLLYSSGDLSEEYSEKLSIFIRNSFAGISTGNNYIFLSFFILSIAGCVFYFANYAKYAIFALMLAIFLFPVLNFFVDAVWIRRIIFSILMLPAVPKIWGYLLSGISLIGGGQYYQNLLKFISGICLLILVIPGFYLPPFFDGIAGWYIENDSPQSYQLNQLRIRFDDNTTAWFRPSFFNPITQHNRPFTIINRRDPAFYNSDEFYHFLHRLYKKAYPSLTNFRLPTEEVLGRFAYRPHTLDRFDSRENFLAPSQIIAFELVVIENINGTRTEVVQQSWSIQ